jgi:HEAT repeat protein
MKRAILIGLLLLLPSFTFAQSAGDAAEQNVVLRLNHLHQTPTLDELNKVSPNARKVVERVARTSNGLAQAHAIQVLAEIGDGKARDLLVMLFNAPETREMTRHSLLNALVVHFGAESLALAKTWLHSEDMDRRLTAIHALGQLDTPASLEILDAHLLKVKSGVEEKVTLKALEHVR